MAEPDLSQDQNQDQNQNQTKPSLDQNETKAVMSHNQNQHVDKNQKTKQQPKPARTQTQPKIQTRVQPGVQPGAQPGAQTGVQIQQNHIEEKSKEAESFCSFIYNPQTGAVLGRTKDSWGRILLFYLIFYLLLSAMFCFTLWTVLLTLDPDAPKYNHLLQNPGLVVQPQVLEISYNRSEPSEYGPYVEQLHRLLQKYNDSIQAANDLCLAGEFTIQNQTPDQSPDQSPDSVQRKVCQFRRSVLRSCSGLSDTNFGFKDGRPCVIISMNRVVGLKPSGDPFINCTSKTPLKMQYFPPDARLDRMFFPYYGKRTHSRYVQPLVALKLLPSRRDGAVSHHITCRVEGSGIQNQNVRDRNQGRVSFKVRVTQ